MQEKKFDVVTLGELLIDFISVGTSEQGNPIYEANPGGAPCNVLSMLSKLNRKTAFIGKVGNDAFGMMLKSVIEEEGIDATNLLMDEKVPTTLALVSKKEDGDRDFSFYRKPGADIMLSKEEINEELLKDTRIFHFGSLSLTDEPVRSATQWAIEKVKEENILISFDPNLRELLWADLDHAKEEIDWGLGQCDILKISDNEITWFTGKDDYDEGVKVLQEKYPNIQLITVSMGKDGSRMYLGDQKVESVPFLQEGTIETTGAGDTFCACVLDGVLSYGIDMDVEHAKEVLMKANAAASIVTTRKGALRVMPTEDEVTQLIDERS